MTSTGVIDSIPPRLLTDRSGPSERMRVDPGQTGFFAGRFFRTYTEQVIPVAGPSVQFRFTSPVDFILWSQRVDLTQGAIMLRIYTGAVVPGGVWTPLPIIGVNRMNERPQPYYAAQVTADVGGTFTGGTEVDVLLLRSGGKDSEQNVGGESTERGLPPGTYYGRLATLTGGVLPIDAAQLVYSITWEERVP